MKVLNLQCGQQHSFEGWFGSEDDFQSQLARSLVACPLCGDTGIKKLLSAPRLNLGATDPQADTIDQPDTSTVSNPVSLPSELHASPMTDRQAHWLQKVREVLAHTDDVGEQFASEARRMHYGETDHRPIRGHATADQALELLEEGIPVMPLPMPAALKGTLH